MNEQTHPPLDFSGMTVTSTEPNLFYWPLVSADPATIVRVCYSADRGRFWVEAITRVGSMGEMDAATEEHDADSPADALAKAQVVATRYTSEHLAFVAESAAASPATLAGSFVSIPVVETPPAFRWTNADLQSECVRVSDRLANNRETLADWTDDTSCIDADEIRDLRRRIKRDVAALAKIRAAVQRLAASGADWTTLE